MRLGDLPFRLLFMHRPFQLHWGNSLLGFVLLGACLWRLRRGTPGVTALFVGWYLVIAAAYSVIDLLTGRQVLSHLRYVSLAAPGLVGMLVAVGQGLPRFTRRAAATVLLVIVLFTLRLPTQDNPHGRRAAELIGEQYHSGMLLVFDATGWQPYWITQIYHDTAYYIPQYLPSPGPPVILLREPPSPEVRHQIGAYDGLIIVSTVVDGVPDPISEQFKLQIRSGYIHQIGCVYVFQRAQ